MLNEYAIVCARRLRLHRPDLTAEEIRMISGTSVYMLQRDPAFNGPMDELRNILTALPRREDEDAMAYAERVRMQRSELSLVHLDMISGVGLARLVSKFRFAEPGVTLNQHLTDKERQIRADIPWKANETASAYALRILTEEPTISTRGAARVVGIDSSSLGRARYNASARTAEARATPKDRVRQATTGAPPERHAGEPNIRYAVRLYLHDRSLSHTQLMAASGATPSRLAALHALMRTESDLVAIGETWPRAATEIGLQYGLRLLSCVPSLTVEEAALLAGVNVSTLQQMNRPGAFAASSTHSPQPLKTPPNGPPTVPSASSMPTKTLPTTSGRRNTPY